jgi:hypothetical protein
LRDRVRRRAIALEDNNEDENIVLLVARLASVDFVA